MVWSIYYSTDIHEASRLDLEDKGWNIAVIAFLATSDKSALLRLISAIPVIDALSNAAIIGIWAILVQQSKLLPGVLAAILCSIDLKKTIGLASSNDIYKKN